MTENESPPMDRRDFLRVGGTVAATSAMVACQAPAETSVPFHQRPEGLRTHGKTKTYATVIDGAPVLVRTREGRPVLIAPNPDNPSGRGLTVRSHAALLDLYDPDRASGPLSVRRGQGAVAESDWSVIDAEITRRLNGEDTVALLTGPITGPASLALIAELEHRYGVRHVTWSPIVNDAPVHAWRAAFGGGLPPRPRLDRADVIVGFGAEFIDLPGDGLESEFARRRTPGAQMNRFIQLEGRLSLTGANADSRVRVRDLYLANVAAAIARRIIVDKKIGPLAGNGLADQILVPFTKAPGVDPKLVTQLAEELVASRGRSIVLAGGTACATPTGLALAAAVLLINHSLGNYESPLFERRIAPPGGGFAELATLTDDLRAKKVSTLIVAGANPIYDAPATVRFKEAMNSADFIVSLNDRVDETSALADYLAPASHTLESWGDTDLGGGVLAVQQPVVRPLYDTRGLLDILVRWTATNTTTLSTQGTGADYHFLRQHWLSHVLPSTMSWSEVLRSGHLPATSPPPDISSFTPEVLLQIGQPVSAAAELSLQLYPDFAMYDGQVANNGWLHEFPDPITRITWGGAASIAPRRFDDMGLENGDLVEIRVDDNAIVLPAYRHAGMHQDQIAVPLGLGRSACGNIGAGVGTKAFQLQRVIGGRVLRSGLAATLTKTGGHETLALGQGADVVDREPRPVVPLTTLAEYEKDPRAGTEQVPGGKSAWAKHPYDGQRWGMAIDLSKCNGCGKCSFACQAENNIPVVGRQNIIDGREMAWIRIDRYYDAPKREGGWGDDVYDGPLEVVENPVTVFEPMLCQHCENAPCETVCPFNATMHSEDGLNQQAYNRCVGTRYCANNCPFKVRRYNWFEYSTPQTNGFFSLLFPALERHAVLNTRGRMQMKNNPEVTVRSRGVMEKCSFCVQRIREARAEATRSGKDKGALPDGTVVPACMEACPTGAIVFGDINSPESRVSALRNDPRAMRLLESTGVAPAISYLTKVRNDIV